MPFPANWLEELVVEWLDLEGFTTSTGISVPAGRGGRWSPDVVGARKAEGCLVIRHCEATMWLIQGPENAKNKFREKFSSRIQEEVRGYFGAVFGEEDVQLSDYQKWVITCGVSDNVKRALQEDIPEMRIYVLEDFIFNEVLPTINRWRSRRFPRATLPADKWLLQMIDLFRQKQLLNLPDATH